MVNRLVCVCVFDIRWEQLTFQWTSVTFDLAGFREVIIVFIVLAVLFFSLLYRVPVPSRK